eukprot:gnl/MRDRNA2_/MRDRNA2_79856_c0_seq1.p1 gnl/MRDRNA2_/MRDRNA2_79856_c0~~gnl/MRDRNA2_/MRDRNA2_79856_c0_seq1.p1  ORF type:complete len:1020 (+),score=224.64 gnl/MRDRNA2_/MRDRNA2_79856_c0_seq1:174-3233(+)
MLARSQAHDPPATPPELGTKKMVAQNPSMHFISTAVNVAPIPVWSDQSQGNTYLASKHTFLDLYNDEDKASKREAHVRSVSAERHFESRQHPDVPSPDTTSRASNRWRDYDVLQDAPQVANLLHDALDDRDFRQLCQENSNCGATSSTCLADASSAILHESQVQMEELTENAAAQLKALRPPSKNSVGTAEAASDDTDEKPQVDMTPVQTSDANAEGVLAESDVNQQVEMNPVNKYIVNAEADVSKTDAISKTDMTPQAYLISVNNMDVNTKVAVTHSDTKMDKEGVTEKKVPRVDEVSDHSEAKDWVAGQLEAALRSDKDSQALTQKEASTVQEDIELEEDKQKFLSSIQFGSVGVASVEGKWSDGNGPIAVISDGHVTIFDSGDKVPLIWKQGKLMFVFNGENWDGEVLTSEDGQLQISWNTGECWTQAGRYDSFPPSLPSGVAPNNESQEESPIVAHQRWLLNNAAQNSAPNPPPPPTDCHPIPAAPSKQTPTLDKAPNGIQPQATKPCDSSALSGPPMKEMQPQVMTPQTNKMTTFKRISWAEESMSEEASMMSGVSVPQADIEWYWSAQDGNHSPTWTTSASTKAGPDQPKADTAATASRNLAQPPSKWGARLASASGRRDVDMWEQWKLAEEATKLNTEKDTKSSSSGGWKLVQPPRKAAGGTVQRCIEPPRKAPGLAPKPMGPPPKAHSTSRKQEEEQAKKMKDEAERRRNLQEERKLQEEQKEGKLQEKKERQVKEASQVYDLKGEWTDSSGPIAVISDDCIMLTYTSKKKKSMTIEHAWAWNQKRTHVEFQVDSFTLSGEVFRNEDGTLQISWDTGELWSQVGKTVEASSTKSEVESSISSHQTEVTQIKSRTVSRAKSPSKEERDTPRRQDLKPPRKREVEKPHNATAASKQATTSFRIDHIQTDVSEEVLISLIDGAGLKDKYDFIYVPRDKKGVYNYGFAFVNFVSERWAKVFKATFPGSVAGSPCFSQECEVLPTEKQGFEDIRMYLRHRSCICGWSGPMRIRTHK